MIEKIQDLCKEKGITIAKLEKELSFSNGSIYKWDKSSPSIDKVQKIAEYFGVSPDFLLYGFDKSEFTSLVNVVRFRRSIKEFSVETGLDEFYLNRLCSGVEYEQPSVDVVLKIAIHNDNDWIVDAKSIFRAAGYDLEQLSGDLLEDIPLELLRHYQEEKMNETEMAIAYSRFKDAEFRDAMSEPGGEGYEPETIAAHHDGEEWTEAELAEIERFKKFVKSQRNKE